MQPLGPRLEYRCFFERSRPQCDLYFAGFAGRTRKWRRFMFKNAKKAAFLGREAVNKYTQSLLRLQDFSLLGCPVPIGFLPIPSLIAWAVLEFDVG